MSNQPDLPTLPPTGGLAAVFTHHRGELLRFLRARCGDRHDADDLLQELWIKLSTLSVGPVANGRAYLFRMANNLVLDARRSRQRGMARERAWLDTLGRGDAAPELSMDPAPGADDALVQADEARVLAEAIAALPPGAARALRLHRIDGHGQSEVARLMGISRSGVEKHLALAMKHLRRNLLDSGLLDCGSFATTASETMREADASHDKTERGA